MRVLRLTLQYDGAGFVGWQRQAQGASIQGLLEDALATIEGYPPAVVGAGRTDAGVHALGQVASVRLAHAIPEDALVRALNAMLPGSVRVLDAVEADPAFHARFDARAKTYAYRILNRAAGSAFDRRYAWHLGQPLDRAAMAGAARLVVGTHDFAAFQASGSAATSTVRTMFDASIRAAPGLDEVLGAPFGSAARGAGDLVVFVVRGDGFLRHMVRGLAGTLVEIGLGRMRPDDLAALLREGRREEAGPTAPAHGLFLVGVEYEPRDLKPGPESR
jgi:tRNA pseudouridine38-40 synthase